MPKFVIKAEDTGYFLRKIDKESTEWAFELQHAKRLLGIEVVQLYKVFKEKGVKVKAIGEERA